MSVTKHYPEIEANPDFPKLEEQTLAHWQRENLFQKSVDGRPAKLDAPRSGGNLTNNEFVFYDGPPFANGLPHYGHLLTGYVKDVFARYQTMRGKRVERRFGWDCHGLPAEMGSEKELGISGRAAITAFGIGKFNEHCRTSVMKYTAEWEAYVNRQARWVDFKNDYKTMDTHFMESVLWAFKQLYDKGLVYEAHRVMPYSWAAETPLSNFETKLDNSYREREDKAITVAFELKEAPKGAPKTDKYFVLAWTTTPWTLPSNLALAVGKEVEYIYTQHAGACYIIGKNALPRYRKELTSTESITTANLILRPMVAADEAEYLRLVVDKEVMATIGGGARSEDDARKEFQAALDHHKKHGFGAWGVFLKESGQFIGKAGIPIFKLDPDSPESSVLHYILHKEFWNKGYASEVASAWTRYAFETLGQTHLVSGVLPDNLPSIKILEKCGFKKTKQIVFKGVTCDYVEQTADEYFARNGIKGQSLIGLSYHPLFPYFAEPTTAVNSSQHGLVQGAFRILDGSSFVTDGDGTGIVHMAPGFGEDDQKCCAENGIDVVVPVDGQGKYTDAIFDIEGLSLKGLNVIADTRKNEDEPYKEEQLKKFGLANLRIINYLKHTGQLIKQEDFKHNYPHCWRTDQPLIYRAMPSWYVEVTKFRERAVEINSQINWIPEHIRDGQMAHMLATAPDWSISRNRFWGTPIPVWRSKSGKIIVIGSIAELEALSGKKVVDLHRPYIDDITIEKDGEIFTRVEDVFDCWFESGSMPFAQVHYPFENKEWFETHFPADFITEYVGQTRGWFNTLIMLSTALFDKPPFLNCICHGVVLDSETGLKYSKRLKNYKDPMEVMDSFGADALRWLMISSPVMRGHDLAVDPEGKFIRDVVRLAIKPIWNAYNFFTLYANADGVLAQENASSTHIMDRYILAKCTHAVSAIQTALDAYDTPTACDAVMQFFEVLNNWYIRRSKERFWKAEHDEDKQAAYDTLYTVLKTMCEAAAPLLPLTLDTIYRGLTNGESVHLADFPAVSSASDDAELITQMDFIQSICNAALAIRSKQNIRVRQPLLKLEILADTTAINSTFVKYEGHWASYYSIIMDEVNVKIVHPQTTNLEQYATLKLSIHSAVLGKRLPEKMKQILPASKKGEWVQKNGTVEICGEPLLPTEFTLQLEPKPEFAACAQALSSNDALVILDVTLTPELVAEGIARDVVRAIQQARKDANLNVSDRIVLSLNAPEAITSAVRAHAPYIREQTLANALDYGTPAPGAFVAESEVDGHKLSIALLKAA